MLILSRRIGERVMIGDDIVVIVLDNKGGKVKLGFDADKSTPVHREEIYNRIHEEGKGNA